MDSDADSNVGSPTYSTTSSTKRWAVQAIMFLTQHFRLFYRSKSSVFTYIYKKKLNDQSLKK